MYNKKITRYEGEHKQKNVTQSQGKNVYINQPVDNIDVSRQELKETIINTFQDFKELMS